MIMCWNSVPDIRPSFGEIIDLLDMCLQVFIICYCHEKSQLSKMQLRKNYYPRIYMSVIGIYWHPETGHCLKNCILSHHSYYCKRQPETSQLAALISI